MIISIDEPFLYNWKKRRNKALCLFFFFEKESGKKMARRFIKIYFVSGAPLGNEITQRATMTGIFCINRMYPLLNVCTL